MSGTFLTGAAELKNIFMAPLEAVIDADMSLSQKITDFMIRYGFDGEESDDGEKKELGIGRLKMISFTYHSSAGRKQVFSMPVLSLLQIPLLKIRDAEIDMEVRLFSVHQDQEDAPSLTEDTASDTSGAPSFKAYLAPNGRGATEAMSSNLKVKLRMTESDMPAGVVHLLSLMNELNSMKTIKNENDIENEERKE